MSGRKIVLLVCVIAICVIGFLGIAHNESSTTGHQTEEYENTQQSVVESTSPEQLTEEKNTTDMQIEELFASWTLEEKVAQLFFVTPEALTGQGTVTEVDDQVRRGYTTYPVGGVILMKKNLTGPEQTKTMLQELQMLSQETMEVPIFLGVDEEGGTVARVASNTAFGVENVGNMADIGATGDSNKAYEAGQKVGAYLQELGFNLDFAPVVDILTNPENTLMKKRSFGSDAATVSSMAEQFRKGLEEQGVLACVKHFPGHGDTKEDSHEGFAFTDKTLEELRQEELVPFKAQIDKGVSFVMAGHISAPNILGDSCPSSLSKVMITDVLRGELGYEGIVITDALNMGAIAENYSSGEAAVMAFQAGVDILLMPKDFQAAYQAVLDAVHSGEISQEWLEESLVRILKVKLEMRAEQE